MGITRAEIKAVDAQESLCGGVTVLVMGCLTGRAGAGREFVQSFFLAPQEKGYYVLNDILRYVGEGEGEEGAGHPAPAPPAPQQLVPEVAVVAEAAAPAVAVLPNGTVGRDIETVPREQDALPQPEQHAAEPAAPPPQKEEDSNGEEVYNPPNNVEKPVVDEAPVPEVIIKEVPNNVPAAVPSPSPPVPLEEAPKKSYASIVKITKEHRPPPPAVPSRPAPPKPEKQAPPAPALVADAPAFSPNTQSGSFQDPEVDAHAIYVRNLPLSATPQQLEDEFKQFGTIKSEGIQVRSNKIQGFCYGFVEFEDASAVQTAIEASPVVIGDRQCYVEEKRTTGSRVAEEEGLHQVEVVTSEVKALEAVVLTMEAEAMGGASSVIGLIMVAEVAAGVAHHAEVMLVISGLTTLVQPVVVVPGRHPQLLRPRSEFLVAVGR
ncbi:unnamed protein product [Urochloa humidicola]